MLQSYLGGRRNQGLSKKGNLVGQEREKAEERRKMIKYYVCVGTMCEALMAIRMGGNIQLHNVADGGTL